MIIRNFEKKDSTAVCDVIARTLREVNIKNILQNT
jgi:hypothetical protein